MYEVWFVFIVYGFKVLLFELAISGFDTTKKIRVQLVWILRKVSGDI